MNPDLSNQMTDAAIQRNEYTSKTAEVLRSLPAVLNSVDLINVSLLNANWSQTLLQVLRTAKLSERLRNDIHKISALETELASLVQDLASPLQTNIGELLGQLDVDESQELVNGVIDLFDITGLSKPEDMEQRLHELFSSPPPDIESLFSNYNLDKSPETKRLVCHLSCLGSVRALWVQSLCVFNITLRSLTRSSGEVVFSSEVRDTTEESILAFSSQLRNLESNIRMQPDNELLSACSNLLEFIEQELPHLAQLQAKLYLAGHALRRLRKVAKVKRSAD